LYEASDANIHDPAPYLIMGRIVSAESTSSKILNSKLERFVAVQPRNAMARYYYALALSKTEGQSQNLEDRKRIERLLQEAVELDPKLGSAYLQMGILRSQAQDPPGAIRAYHKAIDADPQLTEAHYRLAQAYRLSGETAKSQAELREYEHLSKLTADENERKRHEIRQFVYTLRTSPINSEHH
jgi:tetratricopeptide (TPR) repeat protein